MGYEIRQNLTNVNCEWGTNSPQWIVIHNTANGTSREGTALANTNYFKNVNRSASAHYFVDDGDVVWQCVNDWDTAWHVGDSWSHNGCTNYNSIGIETCETADGSFTTHEIEVLCWLVPMLMERYGIPPERVCRHHDVTGKICPAGYIDQGRWEALKATITSGEDMATAQEIWDYPIDGVPAWARFLGMDKASNGIYNEWANEGIARKDWDYKLDDVPAWARMVGIDRAANGANNAINEYMPQIIAKLDDIEKRLDKIESGK